MKSFSIFINLILAFMCIAVLWTSLAFGKSHGVYKVDHSNHPFEFLSEIDEETENEANSRVKRGHLKSRTLGPDINRFLTRSTLYISLDSLEKYSANPKLYRSNVLNLDNLKLRKPTFDPYQSCEARNNAETSPCVLKIFKDTLTSNITKYIDKDIDLFYDDYTKPTNEELKKLFHEIQSTNISTQDKLQIFYKGFAYILNDFEIFFHHGKRKKPEFLNIVEFKIHKTRLLERLESLQELNFDRLDPIKHYELFHTANDTLQSAFKVLNLTDFSPKFSVLAHEPWNYYTYKIDDLCIRSLDLRIRFLYIDYNNFERYYDLYDECKQRIITEITKMTDKEISTNRDRVPDLILELQEKLKNIVDKKCRVSSFYSSEPITAIFSNDIARMCPQKNSRDFSRIPKTISVILINSPSRSQKKRLSAKFFYLTTSD